MLASALPFSLICWPSAKPGRDLDLDLLAGGQLTRRLVPFAASLERDRHRRRDVAAIRRLRLVVLGLEATRHRARAGATGAPNISEDVLEATEAAARRPAAERCTPPGLKLKVEHAFAPADRAAWPGPR